MTGYGRGVADRDGIRVIAEVRSVNHRFLDLKVRGSSLEPSLEEQVKSKVRRVCQRGAVSLSLRVERRGAQAAMCVDIEAAKKMYRELTRLSEALELNAPVSLEVLCQQPGVLVPEDEKPEDIAECVTQALDGALTGLARMRETEGQALETDLCGRLDSVRGLVEHIAEHARGAPEQAYERLSERLERLLAKRAIDLDEDRMSREVAMFADRLDVTEELVRLRSHIDHMERIMKKARSHDTPVGRRLDFLVQEMAREINTIGSKSQSADIARAVVDAKAELEKIREQVQNIE